MYKSLMEYNIEQSSSADIKNIKWTHKHPKDTEKPKKKNANKRHQNSSATNINYTQKPKKAKPSVEKIFKVKEIIATKKSKKKNASKRHQNSSASNCKIEQGFSRKGR